MPLAQRKQHFSCCVSGRMRDMQVTVARYTHAYPTFLTIFVVIYFVFVTIVRVMDSVKGLIFGALGMIVAIIAQFIWPAHVLWKTVMQGSGYRI